METKKGKPQISHRKPMGFRQICPGLSFVQKMLHSSVVSAKIGMPPTDLSYESYETSVVWACWEHLQETSGNCICEHCSTAWDCNFHGFPLKTSQVGASKHHEID
jgi:hypothetical protein